MHGKLSESIEQIPMEVDQSRAMNRCTSNENIAHPARIIRTFPERMENGSKRFPTKVLVRDGSSSTPRFDERK